MLGFSSAPVDGIATIQEVSDLITVTPQGNFAIVECTTGILKQDNKLPKLLDRAIKVQKKLSATNSNISKVLPVLVTSKSRENISVELPAAEESGALVIASEDLEHLLSIVSMNKDADEIYTTWHQKAHDAKIKHQNSNITSYI